MEADLNLIPESRYRITSLASRDDPLVTEGLFKGFSHVGNGVVAIAIDTDEGLRRIIPTHMILAIDVISVPETVEEEDEKESRAYFS
ncbi:MAG TPA: hypothetical protein EYP43_03980 [Thermoplasmata archaeon]|nr:hypothetical protein [Thermoplasmata archaeon]